jgi:hypothetical protein
MPNGKNERMKVFGRTGLGLSYAVAGTGDWYPEEINTWPGAKDDGLAWRPSLTGGVELYTVGTVRKPGALRRHVLARLAAADRALRARRMRLVPACAHPFAVPGGGGTLRQQVVFHGDDGFAKVHAAVRVLLPIIPAISAASPFMGGMATGMLDSVTHARASDRFTRPALAGPFIPEAVFAQEDYYREVFGPMAPVLAACAEAPFDPQTENRRGAIALFDQGVIELRVVNMQECPMADLAVAGMILAVLKALVSGRWVSSYLQRAWSEQDLLPILDAVVRDGDRAVITDRDFLMMFGLMKQDELPVADLWKYLFVELYSELGATTRSGMAHIMEHGCLARRILAKYGAEPGPQALQELATELADHLEADRMFV